jgi:BlaI family transcriptional regulator, penicillinase repressor
MPPEAKSQVMKAIRSNELPVTSSMEMGHLSGEKSWPLQSVSTIPGMLGDNEFFHSQKGMERQYYPFVSKEDYLQFETGNFVVQYHENSFISRLSTLHQDKELTDEDIGDLQEWIRKRRYD